MAVGVECNADVRVTQHFRDYLWVDAFLKKQRSRCVSQVVKPCSFGQSCSFLEWVPGSVYEVPRAYGSTVARGEDPNSLLSPLRMFTESF
jgi:hypothetical protein